MFSLEDCIERPLDIAQLIFEQNWNPNRENCENQFGIPEYFQSAFQHENDIYKIPSLNDIPVDQIQSNTLVRFRGMIQNTFLAVELYAPVHESLDRNGDQTWKLHRYQDYNDEEQGLGPNLEQQNSHFDEKCSFYVTSVPGETEWARKISFSIEEIYGFRSEYHQGTQDPIEGLTWQTASLSINNTDIDKRKKRIDSKYPFPNEKHIGVVVKIYEKDASIKVTDVVEFVGVLEEHRTSPNADADGDGFVDPLALLSVPCIHSIFFRKIHPSGNPLLHNPSIERIVRENAREIRRELIRYIASVFYGDELVAEFLLLQLLSRVHSRRSGLILGKFALNITNISSSATNSPTSSHTVLSSNSSSSTPVVLTHKPYFSSTVSALLSSLLPRYHDLPLTLEILNNVFMYPRNLDADDGFLESGVLQVSEGTRLLIDETVLQEGKLGESGVRNIQAIEEILTQQKLGYAFPFHTFQYETDIGVIILSNARSLLPCDCTIPLSPTDQSQSYQPNEKLINDFRSYLSALRYADYTIPEDVSLYIQNHYVNQRREAAKSGNALMTQDDLNFRMTLARLVTLSFNETMLTTELWDYTQSLDDSRQGRINQFQ
ncbi:839_t:CDS:10 [Paraglomus occultum]|uniref:839_t:CDS:1 n=1 Tax=Paraglomus occultum TaxID=144539 RepID=A0A9N9BE17_9GLOM|nr:839_t:CDS:10 [Paraglomus occultum]